MRAYGVSSGFGARVDPISGAHTQHHGIDLPAPLGQPVQAAYDGVITRAEPDAGGYGQLVVVDHGGGVETRYAHLSAIDVRAGQRVHRGETLGAVGSSGRSTGPHLHFELRRGGDPVDPTHSVDPRSLLGRAKEAR
jgi:murein DD-endopeptidase MepM/ murein hydrolase activator NlpD